MSETTPINICEASGCSALCCQNVKLYTTAQKREQIFPGATRVADEKELAGKLSAREGVYCLDYSPNRLGTKRSVVLIIGKCPNLSAENQCAVYANRPQDCRRFKIASTECNELREQSDIPIVNSSLNLTRIPARNKIHT